MTETKGKETGQELQRPAEGTAEWYDDLVPVRLFKDNAKYSDDVFVAVNGRGFLIQRGVTVEVPRYVALVLEQSMDQDQRAAELMDREAAQYAAAAQARGL